MITPRQAAWRPVTKGASFFEEAPGCREYRAWYIRRRLKLRVSGNGAVVVVDLRSQLRSVGQNHVKTRDTVKKTG